MEPDESLPEKSNGFLYSTVFVLIVVFITAVVYAVRG